MPGDARGCPGRSLRLRPLISPTGIQLAAVAGSSKTAAIHKRFQQGNGVTVVLLSVPAQPPADLPQQVTGQVRRPYPRQNQESLVVDDAR